MKSIYEHFNDITLDLNSIENELMDIDDITMKKIKNRLMSPINKAYHRNTKRKSRIWVALLLLTIGISTMTLNNSVFADKLIVVSTPYINTLFSKFKRDNYNGRFEDYTQVIGKSVKDKGHEVTLDEIIMDDYSLMIVYTIKTEEKIEDIIKKMERPFPYIPNGTLKINDKQFEGGVGGNHKIIDDNTVQIMMDYDMNIMRNEDIADNFTINISFDEINNVKGDWAFKFDVTKSKISFSSISTAITFKANKEFEYNYINFSAGGKLKERGVSSSYNALRSGYKFEGMYKFDYTKEIPAKIVIEYNKKDEFKVVIGEISLKE